MFSLSSPSTSFTLRAVNGKRRNFFVHASGNQPFSQRIIIPSSGSSFNSSSPDLYLPFRPPVEKSPSSSLSQEQQLEILRERRGLWHEYADIVSLLLRGGFSPSTLDELTGMTGVEQNTIVVGAQVYNSIKSSGISAQYLAYFDAGGAEILYELRTLSAEQRKTAAEYVVEERLDAKGGRDVSRAMKEYERRKREEGHEFFSNHPGDCLGFVYYRQSKEYKSVSEKRSAINKGLEKAVTDSAREKLESALVPEEEKRLSTEKASKVSARIEAIRLAQDETVFRPVPVLGHLEDIDPNSLSFNASNATLEGPFQIFSPKADSQWIALPVWPILGSSKTVLAIPVADVSRLPSFSSLKPTEGMLIIDVSPQEGDLRGECFYVVAKETTGKGLSLQSGSFVVQSEKKPLGRVLLVILPPVPAEPDNPEEWE